MVGAVKAVAQGKSLFSPAIQKALMDDYVQQLQLKRLHDSYDLLTDREKEVATALNCRVNTVATHRVHLMQKLDLHSSADIVLYAMRKRIIV